tara:strand:- start:338 stop:505 length:168 start_codon:yes stop_codon:yes gene_type:complete
VKVGDIIKNTDTKAIGVIVEKHTPQNKQKPFIHVLNSLGYIVRWYEDSCVVINGK